MPVASCTACLDVSVDEIWTLYPTNLSGFQPLKQTTLDIHSLFCSFTCHLTPARWKRSSLPTYLPNVGGAYLISCPLLKTISDRWLNGTHNLIANKHFLIYLTTITPSQNIKVVSQVGMHYVLSNTGSYPIGIKIQLQCMLGMIRTWHCALKELAIVVLWLTMLDDYTLYAWREIALQTAKNVWIYWVIGTT